MLKRANKMKGKKPKQKRVFGKKIYLLIYASDEFYFKSFNF